MQGVAFQCSVGECRPSEDFVAASLPPPPLHTPCLAHPFSPTHPTLALLPPSHRNLFPCLPFPRPPHFPPFASLPPSPPHTPHTSPSCDLTRRHSGGDSIACWSCVGAIHTK
eukprot:359083-Chlamydomonas_euryale.AAC.3